MFEQQSSQDVGSVLGLDLVGDDHLLHHLVGDARQALLVQVQQHRTCEHTHTQSVQRSKLSHKLQFYVFNPRLLPCEMVFRSSNKLRKESEAT